VLRKIIEPKRVEAAENCIMRTFITVLFSKHYQGNQIEEEEEEEMRGTHGRNENCIQNFGRKT